MVSKINPNPFTTRPEIEGTFGVVTSTHWIATAVGMATLEKGGNAFDAAVATAFTLQVVEPHLNGPGGDVPVIVYDVRTRQARSDLRPGAGAGWRNHRALPLRGPRHGAGHRTAGGLRSRHVRNLDAAAARLRHDALADVLTPAISYARDGYPLGRARQRHRRHGRGSVPQALADVCRGLPAQRQSARAGHACSPIPRSPTPIRASCARPKAPAATATRRSKRARKTWSQGFVAEAIDRFCRTQEVMDTSGERHRGVLTADDMARWQPTRRGAADLRLRPLHRLQSRCLEPGAGDAAAAGAAATGFDLDRLDPTSADFIHTAGRMRQARLCRPRQVLRRSGFRRSADRDAAVRRLQRRAPQADRRHAPRSSCGRARSEASASSFRFECRRRAESRRRRRADRRQAMDARRRERPERHPVDGAHSIAPAHARRHRAFRHHRPGRQHGVGDAVRRLAAILAGDPRARLLPRHARADVLARSRSIRPRWRRASARAPRCRRRWRCATASPISPGARPAATSRINGSRSSSCATSMRA